MYVGLMPQNICFENKLANKNLMYGISIMLLDIEVSIEVQYGHPWSHWTSIVFKWRLVCTCSGDLTELRLDSSR